MDKFYSMLGLARKASLLKAGETGCIEAIKKNKAKLLIIAEDASENTKKRFINQCDKNNIKYIIKGEKDDLGNSIGKDLISTIAIVDENFVNPIINLM